MNTIDEKLDEYLESFMYYFSLGIIHKPLLDSCDLRYIYTKGGEIAGHKY